MGFEENNSDAQYGIPSSLTSVVPDESHPVHRLPLWVLVCVLLIFSAAVAYLVYKGSRSWDIDDSVPFSSQEESAHMKKLQDLSRADVQSREKVEMIEALSRNDSGSLSRDEKLQILNSLKD